MAVSASVGMKRKAGKWYFDARVCRRNSQSSHRSYELRERICRVMWRSKKKPLQAHDGLINTPPIAAQPLSVMGGMAKWDGSWGGPIEKGC